MRVGNQVSEKKEKEAYLEGGFVPQRDLVAVHQSGQGAKGVLGRWHAHFYLGR